MPPRKPPALPVRFRPDSSIPRAEPRAETVQFLSPLAEPVIQAYQGAGGAEISDGARTYAGTDLYPTGAFGSVIPADFTWPDDMGTEHRKRVLSAAVQREPLLGQLRPRQLRLLAAHIREDAAMLNLDATTGSAIDFETDDALYPDADRFLRYDLAGLCMMFACDGKPPLASRGQISDIGQLLMSALYLAPRRVVSDAAHIPPLEAVLGVKLIPPGYATDARIRFTPEQREAAARALLDKYGAPYFTPLCHSTALLWLLCGGISDIETGGAHGCPIPLRKENGSALHTRLLNPKRSGDALNKLIYAGPRPVPSITLLRGYAMWPRAWRWIAYNVTHPSKVESLHGRRTARAVLRFLIGDLLTLLAEHNEQHGA